MFNLSPPSNYISPNDDTLKYFEYYWMKEPLSELYLWMESIRTYFYHCSALSRVY